MHLEMSGGHWLSQHKLGAVREEATDSYSQEFPRKFASKQGSFNPLPPPAGRRGQREGVGWGLSSDATHLTFPRLRRGSLPLPPKRRRGATRDVAC